MTRNYTFKTILVIISVVIGFQSCEKEFATVTASGIVDTTTVNFKNTYSKFIIRTKNQKLNPIQSNNMPVGLIGKFNNQEFGSYNAEFLSQLRPSQFNPTFAENLDSLTIEKVILSIPYFSRNIETLESEEIVYELDSVFGNKDSSTDYKSINLNVFESNYFIRDYDPNADEPNVNQKYYSNKSNGVNPINQSELEKNLLLEVNNFSPDPSEIQLFYEDTDSIIERLSPRMYFEFEDLDYWRSKIIEKQGSSELSNSNNFNNYFRGLYLNVSEDNSDGSLTIFDPNQANITIYYNVKDIDDETSESITTNKTYTLSFSGNRINFFNNALSLPVNNDESIHISGTEGSIGILELFDEELTQHPNDETMDDVSVDVEELMAKDILINEANIIIQKTGSNAFEPHRVFIYDLENNAVLSDYNLDVSASNNPRTSITNHLSTLITDTINGEVRHFYKFRITNHIKNIIKKDAKNVKIGLTASADVNLEANGIIYEALDQDFPEKIPLSSNIYPKALILGGNDVNELSDNVFLEIFYTEQK